jgi:hypothetical protein
MENVPNRTAEDTTPIGGGAVFISNFTAEPVESLRVASTSPFPDVPFF